MDMRSLLREMTDTQRERFAKRAKTSVGYLYQLAGGHRDASPKLARKLVQIDARLTLHELRPDIWEQQPIQKAA